ncbi:MAG: hypothetical protein Q9163_005172 [Psora crenata]
MATTSAAPSFSPPRSNYVFINDSNPQDAKSKAKRKLVRAQAARGPHSSTSSSNNRADPVQNPSTSNRRQVLKRKKDKANAVTFRLNLAGLDDLEPQADRAVPQAAPKDDTVAAGWVDNRISLAIAQHNTESSAALINSTTLLKSSTPPNEHDLPYPSSSGTVMSNMPGMGWAPPFVSPPEPGKPYIPMLIDHYLKNLAVAIPELDAGTPFILRKKWFPMVITSPAILYVVLLTAASHYAAIHTLLPRKPIQAILLHLKQQTLTSTNGLIRASPKDQPMSDTIIAAVAKMASYEAMFGTPTLFHTHMRGLQNMIKARGGLEALGLDGLLMRMVLWIDINSAFLLNSKAYFMPAYPLAGHVALQPNPGGFLGAS